MAPGPQNGRYAAEPKSGLTSLTDFDSGKTQYNASVQLAMDIQDGVKRIQGDEVPLLTPWVGKDGVVAGRAAAGAPPKAPEAPKPAVKAGRRSDRAKKDDAPAAEEQEPELSAEGGPRRPAG